MEPTKPGGGAKPSKVEAIKLASQYLKTFVADEVDNGTSHFTEDAATVLKFHGSYQQDDRDVRTQLKKEGKEKAYQFMVRVRIVGGKLDADQYLACDHLAQTVGNGTLRITTRQEFQLHGVLKDDLQSDDPPDQREPAVDPGGLRRRRAERALLPGPARRRASATPCRPTPSAGRRTAPRGRRATGTSGSTARRSRPSRRPARSRCPRPATIRSSRSTARPTCRASSRRPSPCPRTIAPTSMPTTSATWRSSRTGGSSATTSWSAAAWAPPRAPRRRSRSWRVPLCYVDRADVLKIGEAVLKVFRDFGNRSDRKRARLKYIIHDWGMPAFRAKVEEYLGHPLADPKPVHVTDVDDHLGWHPQGDGKLFLGIPVENGRIKDEGTYRLASGLRAFFEKYRTPGRLTCQQSILLADLEPAWRPRDRGAGCEEYGIATVEQVSTVRRWSMACPALPDLRPGRHRGRARLARRSSTSSRSSWRGWASSTSGSPCG